MLFSLLIAGVTSTVAIDSIIAGVTLGTTVYYCSNNIGKPVVTKKK